MFRKTAALLAFLLTLNLGSSMAHAEEHTFSDVKVGLQSYVPLQYFLTNNLIDGYEDNTFRPDEPVTRAEAMHLIKKTVIDFQESAMPLKKDIAIAEKAKEQRFSDVQLDHWAMAAIEFGINQKIINGYENGTFLPDKEINLAEALKMMILTEKTLDQKIQLEEKTSDLFDDVKNEDWFAPYVKEAKKRGMLRFGFKNMIYPNRTLTRGHLADLIFRLLKSRDSNRFFGKATFYSDFFEGHETSNGEKFTQNAMTAANKTLPFNTMVRVTNLKNGQSVDVRISDRGPFNVSLDLDLTSTAFAKIASPSEGIVPVMYEILPAHENPPVENPPENASKNTSEKINHE